MSLAWTQHLVIVPVLLPLLCGTLLLPIDERRHRFKHLVNAASVLVLVVVSVALAWLADTGFWPQGIGVYLAANWSAPFGIALVADRLSALMLLLTALLAFAAVLYSSMRWGRVGVHFHSLFQFLLMGVNGAFLTHDVFNLFVFFEVMLAASYGLVLHGYTAARLRAGMQYITINLVASLLFLIGVALIYSVAGTLNMADLAARVPLLAGDELALLKAGVTVLGIVFLVKSGIWPLGLWLPTTYAAASPPVAAMLVLLTKVGVYVILRLWLLVFPDGAGAATGFAFDPLLWAGMVTIAFGAAGMLATDSPGRMAGYAAIVSSGTMLAAVGYGQPALVPAALFYLLGSTLAMAAFLLLIELVERVRSPGAALVAVTMEAFAIEDTPEQPVGEGIPAALAFVALGFTGCALVIAGVPPLSGFVAKFSLFHALLDAGPSSTAVRSPAWWLMALIVLSGLAAIIALMRLGVRTFWAAGDLKPPKLEATEVLPIGMLLLACVALTIQAGPVLAYLGRTSDDLHRPGKYVDAVLGAPVVPGPERSP
jgi:multicomponent K+:H+ antiporter subunit D